MNKNVASQKLLVFAFDSTTTLPKTGDAANLTAYVAIDNGSVTALTDTSATEKDSTNAKGYYIFDLTQGETNGDVLDFTCKSATANIVVIAVPARVFTRPPNAAIQVIDSSGNARADLRLIVGQTVVCVGTVTFPASSTLASTTNITAGTITTTTNLTNAPTSGDLTATMKASVNAEVDTALADIHLDHFIAVADPGGVVANSSFLAKLVSKSATPAFSSYDNTTDSHEALRDRGDAAWITATGFSTHSAADVWAVGTRVLTAGTNIVLPSNALGNITAWTVDITGSLSGSVGSVTGAVGSVTGNVGGNVVGSVASVTTVNDKTGYTLSATGSAALTQSYGTDGSALTLNQAIYLLLAHVGEFAISGTTKTLKQLDGSTTAATYTLDSSTTPTSITRAT